MANEIPTSPAPPRAWPLFLLGFLVFSAGIGINVVQVAMGQLKTPWYLPILGTLGVVCMAASLAQRFGILRCIGLVLFLLVCTGEWFVILWFSKAPAYEGPVKAGSKLPAFTAAFHDGTPFTQATLEDGQRSTIVFFRGRW